METCRPQGTRPMGLAGSQGNVTRGQLRHRDPPGTAGATAKRVVSHISSFRYSSPHNPGKGGGW